MCALLSTTYTLQTVSLLLQDQVGQDQGGHAFDYHRSADCHAGVVTAFGQKLTVFATAAGRVLVLADGGGGLEGHLAVNGFAVADATQGTACVVGLGVVVVAVEEQFVVVFAAVHAGGGKTATDLETLAGGNGEHGLGQQGIQAVENRFAQGDRRILDQQADGSAYAVALGAGVHDHFFHLGAGGGIRAADGRGFDLFQGQGVQVQGAAVHFADGVDPGDDFGSCHLLQELLGHGASGNTADGFAGGTASTAAVVSKTVLQVVAQVGVARTVPLLDFGVVVAALVFVKDSEGNGCTRCFSFKNARKDANLVLFVAGSGHLVLTGATAVQFGLDVGFVEGESCRATVKDGAYACAMGFTPGRNGKNLTKCARHAQNIAKTRFYTKKIVNGGAI